ncbi:hypothetical protein BU15DRAFT_81309 [Melanogaster broomeanus]|nr:hypothetical protein BU15DRAFT_81309 [Melanogaster broomeanus]
MPAVRRIPSRASTRSSKNAQSLSSIHEDGVEPSESDLLYHPKHDHIPIGRKKMRTSTPSIQKQRAREADPNKGLCLITRRDEPVVEPCHLVARSTKRETITQLEYAWGLRYSSLNLDSRFNVFFCRLAHPFRSRAVAANPAVGGSGNASCIAEWMRLGIPTGFTGSGDGNRPGNASQPPSERAPSADGEGDGPDDGSNSTGTESESGDNAEVSTPSKKPSQGRRHAMDIQSQSSDTEDSVMDDDEWGSSEETAWIEEICDWAEKCREATSSEGGWESDAVNDDQMVAYAKEPSRSAPPPESWHKWRPRWEPRIGNQPQFFNTAKFSSNDWAIYEGRGPLTGFAR